MSLKLFSPAQTCSYSCYRSRTISNDQTSTVLHAMMCACTSIGPGATPYEFVDCLSVNPGKAFIPYNLGGRNIPCRSVLSRSFKNSRPEHRDKPIGSQKIPSSNERFHSPQASHQKHSMSYRKSTHAFSAFRCWVKRDRVNPVRSARNARNRQGRQQAVLVDHHRTPARVLNTLNHSARYFSKCHEMFL